MKNYRVTHEDLVVGTFKARTPELALVAAKMDLVMRKEKVVFSSAKLVATEV